MEFIADAVQTVVSLRALVVSNIVPIAIITTGAVTSYSFLYKRPS